MHASIKDENSEPISTRQQSSGKENSERRNKGDRRRL